MIFRKKKDRGNLIVEERQYILNSKSGFYAKEAFNTLRTNLMFALAEADSNKVIVVTSALQSEGKSLIAVNLSISTATAGYKVLLIDADMRRPKIGRLLQMKSELGLSDILVQPAKVGEAIQPYREGMDVLLAGTIPPNPSELLGSSRMKTLLENLRQRYDFIVFDTPPINPVVDAVVLAPHTDGVLFASRVDHCDRSSVDRALEQLEYANVNILGFVLNGISTEVSGFANGGYRYKRYSRYGRKYGNHQGYGYGRRSGYGYAYGRQPMDPERKEEWQSAVRDHADKQERKPEQ